MKDIMGVEVNVNDTVVYNSGNHIDIGQVIEFHKEGYWAIIQISGIYNDGEPFQYRIRVYPYQILVKNQ